MANRGSAIYCNNMSEKPIEQAIKALYLLQGYDEFEEEIELLKKKIIQLFEDVPIKNGVKTYDKFHYSSSGLCYYSSTSGCKECRTIVEPYEVDDFIEEKKKKISHKYRFVENRDTLIFQTLKSYLKRKVVLNHYYDSEYTIKECIQKYESYNALNEESKECIVLEDLMDKIQKNFNGNMENLFGRNWEYPTPIQFLKESGIKKIIELYTLVNKNESNWTWNQKGILSDLLSNDLKSEDYITIEFTMQDVIDKTEYTHYGNSRYTYTYSFDKFYTILYPVLLKLSKENEYVKNLLINFNIIEKETIQEDKDGNQEN